MAKPVCVLMTLAPSRLASVKIGSCATRTETGMLRSTETVSLAPIGGACK